MKMGRVFIENGIERARNNLTDMRWRMSQNKSCEQLVRSGTLSREEAEDNHLKFVH